MNESNSIKAIDKTNLTEKKKKILSEIGEIIGIEKYFHQEIDQRKSCSKKVNKYVTAFDYIDKILIVLSATTSGVSIIPFTSIVEAPVGIASVSFPLFFSLTTGIITKLLNITRNKKKKHDKILMLAKSKYNIIKTLIYQELIDMEISHDEFITILKEKQKYERMKENLRGKKEKYNIMRFSSMCLKDTSCKHRIKSMT